jgi:muramoyltetrapeptide carboxypeptidase
VTAGARVAVVSPASPFARGEFDAGVAEIERLGFVAVFDDSVFAREGYVAGTAAVRAAAIERYWSDPSVAALIAVRGGFGSAHVIPLLDQATIVRTPKLFVGYSDNTTLLSWLTCHCGLTALHGPMLEGRLARGAAGYDEASFMALLRGGTGIELAPDGVTVLRDGEAAGPLFGGTLTQLVSSLGTPYAFDPPERCLLFLEDVNERPYRLDRMLTQLAHSGILARAAGVVFGEMRGCDEPSPHPSAAASGGMLRARDVVERLMVDFPGPVLYGFPSGHTSGPCWTLPLGVRVRLMARRHPALVVEESPVA